MKGDESLWKTKNKSLSPKESTFYEKDLVKLKRKSIVQLLSSLYRLSLSFFTNFTTKFRDWIVAKMEVSRENRTKLAKFLGFISIR